MLSHINVGVGHDLTIAKLATTISKVIGFKGTIYFDSSKPDGSPCKLMDSTRLNNLGWQAKVNLEDGLTSAYQDFLINNS